MRIDLDAAARSRTDQELVAMLERDHAQYTADALEAARAVARARGIEWNEAVSTGVTGPTGHSPSVLVLAAIGGLVAVVLWFGLSLQSLLVVVIGGAYFVRRLKP